MKRFIQICLFLCGAQVVFAEDFRDADGNIPTYWTEHFKQYNAVIPENQQGSNPADLSKSDKIEIVYRYFY